MNHARCTRCGHWISEQRPAYDVVITVKLLPPAERYFDDPGDRRWLLCRECIGHMNYWVEHPRAWVQSGET